jgi:transposase-like protein
MKQTKSRSSRSTEQWATIIENLRNSGKTVAEFSAHEKISKAQIYLWRKRLTSTKTRDVKRNSSFIELQSSPTSPTENAAAVIIETYSGRRIFLGNLPSSGYMADLIKGL